MSLFMMVNPTMCNDKQMHLSLKAVSHYELLQVKINKYLNTKNILSLSVSMFIFSYSSIYSSSYSTIL